MFPFSTETVCAARCFGSPGMVMMSPVRNTANLAPEKRRAFRTVTVK